MAVKKKASRKTKKDQQRTRGATMITQGRDNTADFGGEADLRRGRSSTNTARKFGQELVAKGIPGLQAEFASLATIDYSKEPHQEFDASQGPGGKNRYANIICFDRTRVKLTYQPNNEGDYIHANFMETKLADLPNKFICTQGPTKSTVCDFWRMVWQTRPEHILMLCKNIEAGKPKCAEYFPPKTGEHRTYGTIRVYNTRMVTPEREKIFESIRITYECIGGTSKDIRILTVHRWLDWPDFGVPTSGLAMFRLIKLFREDQSATVIIHCSAGVGRTGTVMAACIAYQIIFEGKELKILELVDEMRRQRASMIQTEGQYIFLHRALGEYLSNKMQDKDFFKEFFDKYKEYVKNINKPEQPQAPSKSPAAGRSPNAGGAMGVVGGGHAGGPAGGTMPPGGGGGAGHAGPTGGMMMPSGGGHAGPTGGCATGGAGGGMQPTSGGHPSPF